MPVTFPALTQVALALALVAEFSRLMFAKTMLEQGAAAEQFNATPTFPLTVPETAHYTGELLESLGKLARRQGHGLLAHLLDLAQVEARSIAHMAEKPQPEVSPPDHRVTG